MHFNSCFSETALFQVDMLPKGEHESALRYTLIGISDKNQLNGEFCESRIFLYKNLTNQLVVKNRRSKIRTASLCAIFYARFFTLYSLAKRHHKLDSGLANFLEKHPPNETYKKTVDAEIRETLNMEEIELAHRDSYKQSIASYFKNNNMTEQYLAIEEALLKDLESENPSQPHLRDQFNSFNRQTMAYIQRATEHDILYTAKRYDRTANFFKTYATPITVMFTLLPVQWAWQKILP